VLGRKDCLYVVAAVALVVCTPTQIDSARWWRSPRFVAQLGLSAEQSQAIERIFRDSRIEDAARRAAAFQSRQALDRLLAADAPDADVGKAISKAAEDLAAYRRARNLMLYRMRATLTIEQWKRLESLYLESQPRPL